jgi:dienelactone hydrolase
MREQVQIASEVGSLDATYDANGRGARAHGLAVFVDGSGSGRDSPQNELLALALQRRGFATLIVDLLTDREVELDMRVGWGRFDLERLVRRTRCAIAWARSDRRTETLAIALVGSSTGAAAALMLAAERDAHLRAVVSRCGRPDLAGPLLSRVQAPTLLVAPGEDSVNLALNRKAYEALGGPADLVVIQGATHRFEEPGALEEVSSVVGRWLDRHFSVHAPGASIAPAPHLV